MKTFVPVSLRMLRRRIRNNQPNPVVKTEMFDDMPRDATYFKRTHKRGRPEYLLWARLDKMFNQKPKVVSWGCVPDGAEWKIIK